MAPMMQGHPRRVQEPPHLSYSIPVSPVIRFSKWRCPAQPPPSPLEWWPPLCLPNSAFRCKIGEPARQLSVAAASHPPRLRHHLMIQACTVGCCYLPPVHGPSATHLRAYRLRLLRQKRIKSLVPVTQPMRISCTVLCHASRVCELPLAGNAAPNAAGGRRCPCPPCCCWHFS